MDYGCRKYTREQSKESWIGFIVVLLHPMKESGTVDARHQRMDLYIS
jgi:hypothetical protein